MIENPLFNKLSAKTYDLLMLLLVTIMYIALCAEADMYVPAFPQMIKYFNVNENHIQLILSINFIGLCFAGLIAGPLSDSYGRRKILLAGLLVFLISSIGCTVTENFYAMLFWRLFQGIAASFPMVIGAAIFFDKYSADKAGQLCGILNSVISASMAGAPILGAYLSHIFSWRANFIVILILAIVSFVGTLLFIEETLPSAQRKKFSPKAIFADYLKLFSSFKFLTYAMISCVPFVAIVVYVANLSVIFINHLGMNLNEFSYWQATCMGSFIIFSALSAKIIARKGVDYTKDLGSIICLIGVISLFITGLYATNNVYFICLSMAILASGGALMVGTFGAKSMEIFPGINGTCLAFVTAQRQIFASVLVVLSELFFDGTILPVAVIIFCYAAFAYICYLIIHLNNIYVRRSLND
jgi:DHA1 family bicyclomycin/chloramphenicol resistance-like MFS transporter